MEFRGQTAGACKLDSDQCVEIALAWGATYHMQTEDAAEMDQMWAARRGCYIAAGKVREKRGDSVYLSDTCVPISKLAESAEVRPSLLPQLYPPNLQPPPAPAHLHGTGANVDITMAAAQETERDFVKNGLAPVICAHIADGNFHCCVPYQPKDLKEKSKVVELEHELIRCVRCVLSIDAAAAAAAADRLVVLSGDCVSHLQRRCGVAHRRVCFLLVVRWTDVQPRDSARRHGLWRARRRRRQDGVRPSPLPPAIQYSSIPALD